MEIKVIRRFFKEHYTIGEMQVDGMRFCDTLEDRYRDLAREPKVYGHTAIACGTYDISMVLSPRFGRVLPRLLNVPHFEGVLIHRGNTHDDTSGCILVGENTIRGRVVNSTPYEIRLVEECLRAEANGEKITITILAE